MVDTNLRKLDTVKDILKKENRMASLIIDIVFYGSIALAVLSGLIKLLIKIYG